MDNYPKHLGPEFDEQGGVLTPFREWWQRVAAHFPTVPENVAEYWLHEHWKYSPYSYLPSRDYSFTLTEWPAERLRDVRSRWCDFDPENTECWQKGRQLIDEATPGWVYKTAVYMLEHGNFPAPIIILDNRDNHLKKYQEAKRDRIPAEYILIEGHRRFNLALYLQRTNRLRPNISVWLMCQSPGPII
jgi:hypothetical protein